mmetsp:Transcript_2922/g.3083  ORF Transcript_2922/g.3083 Transcript_2922/m.3083 type:complete len:361 (+) Transcript_2922:92-1174(+)
MIAIFSLVLLSSVIIALSYVSNPVLRQRTSFVLSAEGKKPEQKNLVRVLKQTIFPGIFQSYEDTGFAKKTVIVKTKDPKPAAVKSRYESVPDDGVKAGSGAFNVVDKSTIPKYVSANDIKGVALKPIKKPDGFKPPVPKKAGGKLGSAGKLLDNIPKGALKQKKPIILYDSESTADCKKVREALSLLDLIAEIRPCPGRFGWSDTQAIRAKGKRDVPFMVDENPSMYRPELTGADLIIKHLFNTYGPGEENIPARLKGGRGGDGKGSLDRNARSDFLKIKPIELYGVEGAPYVKPVREALQSLALAHIFIPCAEGSKHRAILERKSGSSFQVPFIVDPNTGVQMFESAEIVKYLKEVYVK